MGVYGLLLGGSLFRARFLKEQLLGVLTVMKSSIDIHGPHRTNPSDCGDPLTFYKVHICVVL